MKSEADRIDVFRALFILFCVWGLVTFAYYCAWTACGRGLGTTVIFAAMELVVSFLIWVWVPLGIMDGGGCDSQGGWQ